MARELTGHLEIDPKTGLYKARVSLPKKKGEKRNRPWLYLGTADEAVAKRRLARELENIKAGKLPGDGEIVDVAADTVAEFYDAHEGDLAEGDRVLLKTHVVPSPLGRLAITVVTEEHVSNLLANALDNRAAKNAKSAGETSSKLIAHETRRKLRGSLFRLFEIARKGKTISKNPVTDADLPVQRGEDREIRKRRVILNDAEFNAFISCPTFLKSDVKKFVTEKHVRDVFAPGRLELQVMALVARCEGGMRTGDVCQWTWPMIDRTRFASCLVARSKTAEPQQLEIPKVLRGPLRTWWEHEGRPSAGPVFPVRRGDTAGEHRTTRGTSFAARLRRDLKRALGWAGIEERPELFTETKFTRPVDFHSFRRAFNTGLAKAGLNVQTAMVLAGHSDARTHLGYVQLAAEQTAIPEAALPKLGPLLKATKAKVRAQEERSRERSQPGPLRTGNPRNQRATKDSNLWPSAPEADALSS